MARHQRTACNRAAHIPSDDELVAFVTGLMKSIEVAAHFKIAGPLCLHRMRSLADRGRLSRPHYGYYGPVALAGAPKPLRGRTAEILAFLSEPRTVIEVGDAIGCPPTAVVYLSQLIREGLVVHRGPNHYVRADIADQFAPRARRRRDRTISAEGMAFREEVLAVLTTPHCSAEVAAPPRRAAIPCRLHAWPAGQGGTACSGAASWIFRALSVQAS